MKYRKNIQETVICIVVFMIHIGNAFCQKDCKIFPDWVLGPFVRPTGVNPVISPDPKLSFYCPMNDAIVKWAESDVFNPAATIKDNKIVVLYRAEDNSAQGIGSRTSRIGYAESRDGIKMTIRKTPVLYPDNDNWKDIEWTGGCEDPRVAMTEDGTYVMFYTAWNKKTARLAIATSKNLINWEKHGLAFEKAYNGRFKDLYCKAASVVTTIKNGKQVITQVNGKYFMYWGEHSIYAATSDDLINWEPVLDENNELKVLAAPRKGYFDSGLSECGPPAILTENGILLLYNGKNGKHSENGDPDYPEGVYCAGQILFDANNPYKIKERLDKPFFFPQDNFEKSGQYLQGTVFIEGLVYFNNKYFLYYGCADSQVAVAIYEPDKKANK